MELQRPWNLYGEIADDIQKAILKVRITMESAPPPDLIGTVRNRNDQAIIEENVRDEWLVAGMIYYGESSPQ